MYARDFGDGAEPIRMAAQVHEQTHGKIGHCSEAHGRLRKEAGGPAAISRAACGSGVYGCGVARGGAGRAVDFGTASARGRIRMGTYRYRYRPRLIIQAV